MADGAGAPQGGTVTFGGPRFHSHPPGVNGQSEDRLRVDRPLESLVEDMNAVRAGGVIALYCGEASPTIYNADEFIETAQSLVAKKQAKITAISGPILLVPNDERETNGLIRLAQDGVLKGLYHRRARFETGHFRVVETDDTYRYYLEHTHAPGEPVENRWCEDMGRFSEESKQAQAEEALDAFWTWKSMAVPHAEASAAGLPLITTKQKLRRVVAHVRKRGGDFNYLGPTEILEAAAEVGKHLIGPLAECRRT